MSLKTYKINYSLINSSELVREASREELLVLLSLIASDGRMTAEEDVAQVTHLSLARVKSAIALWQAEEIISLGEFSPEDDKYAFAEIIDEFEQKKITSEIIDEEMSAELAKKIRNDELADVIEEIDSPTDAQSVYDRLVNDKNFPVGVLFDWKTV